MRDTTTSRFINTLFPQDILSYNEAVVIAYPDQFTNGKGEEVHFYRQQTGDELLYREVDTTERGWLFCVSSVIRPNRGEKVRRRKQDVRRVFVLVLDDIGTKSQPLPNTMPNYILETSPGNFQHGYLLNPIDVSIPENEAFYDGCCLAFAEAGYNDPGCRGVTRVVKLPGAVHKSGFITRLHRWDTAKRWELQELMDLHDLEPVPCSTRRRTRDPNFQGLELAAVYDPIWDWIKGNWQTYGHNNEWVFIECPWRHFHTDEEQGATSTGYSPMNYGFQGAAFKCFHGHCHSRTTADFQSEIAKRRNRRA